MANAERYVPEDSGDVVVQPNLSLSLREILDRWAKEMPLDIMTRSGSFMLGENDEPDDGDFDVEDMDLMDPVEAEQYAIERDETRQSTMLRRSKKRESYSSELAKNEKTTESETDEA